MGQAVKIVDLATRMIELAGYRPDKDIKIEFTGLRPGEKLYEEVLSDKENTIPTENQKIMIAKVRRYEYADILDTYAEFEKLSRAVKILDTVKLMMKVVPEFKSKTLRSLKCWIKNNKLVYFMNKSFALLQVCRKSPLGYFPACLLFCPAYQSYKVPYLQDSTGNCRTGYPTGNPV